MLFHSIARLLPAGLLLGAAAVAAPQDANSVMVLQAGSVHLANGNVLENGRVVIRDGRILAVGAEANIPASAIVIELDGHLSAGMVALADSTGLGRERVDDTRWLMPDAQIAEGFRGNHPDLARMTAGGVTTVVLTPGSGLLSGGRTAVVKPAGGKLLKGGAHLHLNFGSSMFTARASAQTQQSRSFFGSPTRYPNGYRTSYSGALALLEDQLVEPQGAFAAAVSGKLPVLLQSATRAEAGRAAAFAGRHGLQGILAGGSRIGELAESIAKAKLGVMLAPFSPGQSFRLARSAKQLNAAGVAFGFALDAPTHAPDSLRMSAAACMREGLAADAAWRALTQDAANLAGVADRVGDVAPGRDADLVLWSGPPTELTSRVLSVWSDGVLVHSGDDQ
ncbi:MAG: hypothetical protein ACI8QC_002025 [Planctomycetota bacterium]|jgi:hypothetical protein